MHANAHYSSCEKVLAALPQLWQQEICKTLCESPAKMSPRQRHRHQHTQTAGANISPHIYSLCMGYGRVVPHIGVGFVCRSSTQKRRRPRKHGKQHQHHTEATKYARARRTGAEAAPPPRERSSAWMPNQKYVFAIITQIAFGASRISSNLLSHAFVCGVCEVTSSCTLAGCSETATGSQRSQFLR